VPETEAIFENVAAAHKLADTDPKVLRLSIDTKAKVAIGNLSRGGKARVLEPLQADDHDHYQQATLVPLAFSMSWAISSLSISVNRLKPATSLSIV